MQGDAAVPDTHLRLRVAQTTSSNRHKENISELHRLARAAADDGAQMLALPEAAGLLNRDRDSARRMIVPAERDPYLADCREAAVRHGLWIQPGSTPVSGTKDRFRNRATLISPAGEVVARYDKIHLFDIFLEGRAASGESERYSAGEEAVMADTPWGPMALSICYDLRFPHLFRDYAKEGALLTFVPSAFTVPTGRVHWEVLLRARAIENGMWIVAAAQVGHHADGRRTYGHSMVINPWGEVIRDLGGDQTGAVTLDLDIGESEAARRQIPSLKNERAYRLMYLRGN